MTLLPLTLGVKRNIDASVDTRGKQGGKRKALNRSQINALLQKTIQNDSHTCRYCGFKSRQFQKAIPKDWGVSDPRDAEMVTACIFCEQVLALETVAPMASGALMWLPEMSQTAINHICRTIYIAKAAKNAPEKIIKCATRALEVFTVARGEAKRRISTDDPAVLAAALMENLDETAYRKRSEKLEGVRVLPLEKRIIGGRGGQENDQFPKIIVAWAAEKESYGQWPIEQWEKLLASA